MVSSSVMGYSAVYLLEMVLLGLTLWAIAPMLRPLAQTPQASA